MARPINITESVKGVSYAVHRFNPLIQIFLWKRACDDVQSFSIHGQAAHVLLYNPVQCLVVDMELARIILLGTRPYLY